MFLQSEILFLYAESAVHAGAGSGLGAVDLPIQRERTTSYPTIQASGVKGAIRSQSPDTDDAAAVFGLMDNPEYASAISPGDARILLFPVRALRGVFVWITSGDVLARFSRDLSGTGRKLPFDLPYVKPEDPALVSDAGLLLDNKSILLEEFSFEAKADKLTRAWAAYLAEQALPQNAAYDPWRQRLVNHLVILSEDDFRDFVRYSTEIVTRIKISPETKTVAKGALFSQELLPADALMYTTLHASRLRLRTHTTLLRERPEQEAQAVLEWVYNNVPLQIQIGGDETVGRGLVHLHWLGDNR